MDPRCDTCNGRLLPGDDGAPECPKCAISRPVEDRRESFEDLMEEIFTTHRGTFEDLAK